MLGWASIIEKSIQKAINDGVMTDLPGAGRPMQLSDDPHTPPELRLAHKLLKDNDLAPEWIVLGNEIERRRRSLAQDIKRGLAAYRGALGDAKRLTDPRRAEAHRRPPRPHGNWLNRPSRRLSNN